LEKNFRNIDFEISVGPFELSEKTEGVGKKNEGLTSMEIEVKLFATLRDYLPKGSSRFSCKMEFHGSTRVQDILSRLQIPEEIPKIILINGVHGKKEQVLKEGDVLSIFPPVAGG
jgi:sulfur carrier protein